MGTPKAPPPPFSPSPPSSRQQFSPMRSHSPSLSRMTSRTQGTRSRIAPEPSEFDMTEFGAESRVADAAAGKKSRRVFPIVMFVLFICVSLTLTLVDYYFPKFHFGGGRRVLSWAGFMGVVIFGLPFFQIVFHRLAGVSVHFDILFRYAIAMSNRAAFSCWTLAMVCFWATLMRFQPTVSIARNVTSGAHDAITVDPVYFMEPLLWCLVLTSLSFTALRFGVLLVSKKYQVSAYFSRMREALFAEYVLESLSKLDVRKLDPSFQPIPENDVQSRTSEQQQQQQGTLARFLKGGLKAFDISQGSSVSMEHLSRHFTQQDPAVLEEENSPEEAKKFARKLFKNAKMKNRNFLLPSDFRRFLDREKAEIAFSMFDTNMDGQVTLEDVELVIGTIFSDRIDIAKSLQGSNQIVAKMENVLSPVLFFFLALLYLVIFNVDIESVLVSAGAFALATTFVFANWARTVFEAAIFLFVSHPYDVGDRVWVNLGSSERNFKVAEINLMDTVFEEWNNSRVMIPNTTLARSIIINVRRSKPMFDEIKMMFKISVTTEQLKDLEDHVELYVNSSPDFISFSISPHAQDRQSLIWILWVQHFCNFQEGGRYLRRGKLFLYIKTVVKLLGIEMASDFSSDVGAGEPRGFAVCNQCARPVDQEQALSQQKPTNLPPRAPPSQPPSSSSHPITCPPQAGPKPAVLPLPGTAALLPSGPPPPPPLPKKPTATAAGGHKWSGGALEAIRSRAHAASKEAEGVVDSTPLLSVSATRTTERKFVRWESEPEKKAEPVVSAEVAPAFALETVDTILVESSSSDDKKHT